MEKIQSPFLNRARCLGGQTITTLVGRLVVEESAAELLRMEQGPIVDHLLPGSAASGILVGKLEKKEKT